jgi:AcrR family transcriptional regulator
MPTLTSRPGRPKDPELQERRSAEILDVAIRVFAASGFRNTDVQQIADELGLGKGTIYRYFDTKEKLFLAAADAGMQQLERHIHECVQGVEDPLEFLRTGALAYVAFFQQRPELVEILIQERAEFRESIPATHLVYRNRNRGIVEEMVRRGVEAGIFRTVDVREATTTLGNLLYGTVVCGCLEGSSRKLTRMAEQALDVVLHGLLAERD